MKISNSIFRLLTGTVLVGILSACSGGTSDSSRSGPTPSASSSELTPASPPELSFAQVKLMRFTWADAPAAAYYRLLENADGHSGFTDVSGQIAPGVQAFDHQVPLFARLEAQYVLQSCDATNSCEDSAPILVSNNLGGLAESIGHLKASNSGDGDWVGYSVSLNQAGDTLAVGAPSDAFGGAVYVFTRRGAGWHQRGDAIRAINADPGDEFGYSVSLNDAGDILAVGAYGEDSGARGVNPGIGEPTALNRNDATNAGAVYVFSHDGTGWSQQAYIKASNPDGGAPPDVISLDRGDEFGWSVSLNGTGNTLAVGAHYESGSAEGIHSGNADAADDNDAKEAGAVYVFTRISDLWSQQAYIKASNTDSFDEFGGSVSLSGTGDTLAVGAEWEDSNAKGTTQANQTNNSADQAGAVYVFTRNGTNWSQQAYIKASNTDATDQFGISVSLDGAGNTLAVGAHGEESASPGVGGDESNNALGPGDAGAVYVFTRSGGTSWSQQAYIKASNPGVLDGFGRSVSLSDSGNTLAVGAPGESSAATGVYLPNGGDQADDSLERAGAVYVYTRDGTDWSHQAYVKASIIGIHDSPSEPVYPISYDYFGQAVSLDGAGETLAVGAPQLYSDGAVFLY